MVQTITKHRCLASLYITILYMCKGRARSLGSEHVLWGVARRGQGCTNIASKMGAWAALVAALMILSGFRTEGAPATKSLETLVQGLEPLRLKAEDGVMSGLTCDVCKAIVDIIDVLYSQSKTEDEIASVLTTFCIDFKIEDRNVCSLVIPEFKDEVLTVFEKVALSSEEICGFIIGPTCAHDYNPYDQEWNVTIPGNKPPVTPVTPPKSGSPVTRILHLSDFHWDPAYTPGLTNDCGEPLCCRVPNPPGNGSTAAGNWGDYKCDVPYRTLENLMEFLGNMSDEFDWVYWTGDLPPHNVWNQSRENQLYILDTMVTLMKKHLPNKLVFPSLGNHESAPVNSFPPPFITGPQSNDWLLNAAAEQWSEWLPEEAMTTIKRGGFYNVKLRDGLRVISLQTNYGNGDNYWLLINSTDPAGQLQWLIQQLLAAEENGEKVHIIGHIHPPAMTKTFSWNYYKIVNRFESTIVGQFFGHTHQDYFVVFFDEDRKRATNVAFLGPAVTTYQEYNLGFRIYTMDGEYNGTTNALLDHKVYYMNLTDANLTNKPKWQLEYSAKDAFGLKALQPADWADLINRFEQDEALFQQFYQFIFKMHAPACDAACKAATICSLKKARSDDPDACKDSLPAGITTEMVEHLQLRDKLMC